VLRQILNVIWKTAFFYFLLVTFLRIAGKREIGNLSATDLVAFILLSEAAIITVADDQIPFIVGLAPVLVIGALEMTLAYVTLKSQSIRALLEGGPTIVVAHGQVDERQLRRLRFNVSNLLAELRLKNVPKVEDVEFAILESTGKLSVVPRAGCRPTTADDMRCLQIHTQDPNTVLTRSILPVPVICDGWIDHHALRLVGHDEKWLRDALAKQGHDDPRNVLLAMVEDQSKVIVVTRRPNGPQKGSLAQ
jgi:uncharacterized membrane protein YcaP (DUF421 family)